MENRAIRPKLVRVVRDNFSGLYIFLVILAAAAGFGYGLVANGLFACSASFYESNHYTAYCHVENYGDYDHGAFWFGLEPETIEAASEATVLFVGNSRMQFALSTPQVDNWFTANSISYYLLGFSHSENYLFIQPLLEKMKPRAEFFVVNVDRLFDSKLSRPGNDILNNPNAPNRYRQKRVWQMIHAAVCGNFSILCRNQTSYLRDRHTGAWSKSGAPTESATVEFDLAVNQELFDSYEGRARQFVAQLAAKPDCVFFTAAPDSDIEIGTAKALAQTIGVPFVAPVISGLTTFDETHLDIQSSANWASEFMELASPLILSCLNAAA